MLTVDDRLTGVELADGRLVELDAIFTAPRPVPADALLRGLGAGTVERTTGSFTAVDPSGRTSVDGVWAAGNVVNENANVPMSIGAGAAAGGTVNYDLVLDDIRIALAGHTAEGAAR